MDVTALVTAFAEQRIECMRLDKRPEYIRLTCEQFDILKANESSGVNHIAFVSSSCVTYRGLPVVTKGGLRDCNLRKVRPRVVHIDLTKVE